MVAATETMKKEPVREAELRTIRLELLRRIVANEARRRLVQQMAAKSA